MSEKMESADFNDYFDNLLHLADECAFAMALPSSELPWIEKFVWITRGNPSLPAEEYPLTGYNFHIGVRNPSGEDCTVRFDCLSKKGKILFDKGEPEDEGVRFRNELRAVPARKYRQVPNIESTGIRITELKTPTEEVLVALSDLRSGLSDEGTNSESREVLFRFEV